MTTEIVKNLEDAKGRFEIDIKGFAINLTADHCDGGSWFLAIHTLIERLSAITGMPVSVIAAMVIDFSEVSKSIVCESKEQRDVIKEIFKQKPQQ